jgi:glyoxylase I family protein
MDNKQIDGSVLNLGYNNKIGGGGFHHVAIRASNFEASIQFYTEGLGFTERLSWGEGDSRGILLDTGDGNYLEVFAGGRAESKSEGAILHMAFRTNDLTAAIEAARAAGAEITKEPTDIDISKNPLTPVRIAFCKGPDGEILEFFQSTGDNQL